MLAANIETRLDGVSKRTKICIYCGSSMGHSLKHMEAARKLAQLMAAKNCDLVYGGGTVGLMGEVAKTLVSISGPDAVHGIIPEALVKFERDDTYRSICSENKMPIPDKMTYGRTTVVKDMHTRKRMMAEEVFAGGPGSGFIALSGGYGTIEEILEAATWVQLGIHSRGVCLLNIDGFFDGILKWIKQAVEEQFIRPANAAIIVTVQTPEDAIDALLHYRNRVIIDTDPGVDDVLAILQALSSSPEDLEVLLLSVTYGNVPVASCLRNVVALFHVLEKEMIWREANGKHLGFDALKAFKPLVAVGATHPLEEDELAADHFRE
ncbi:Bifunctional cytokinin biosynthesis protein [Colletotrichum sp. SAR 10_76]|nr:Bifunctional cytokinin biosynthesis protein [Colletotrichum sp. SAR 10_76]